MKKGFYALMTVSSKHYYAGLIAMVNILLIIASAAKIPNSYFCHDRIFTDGEHCCRIFDCFRVPGLLAYG